MKSTATLLIVLVLGTLALPPTPAWAGAPTDQLKASTDEVVKILDDPRLKADERRAAVRRVAVQAFDVEEAARRALGRHWAARTPEERREFVELFSDLLERTYVSKIDLYGGERVVFTQETVDGDRAVIRGKLLTKRGTEVPLEARMLRHGDRWLMYDVLVENISLVGNYRAQFDQIIRTASYAELVKRLRAKRLEAAPAPARTSG